MTNEIKKELLKQLHNDIAMLYLQSIGKKEELIAQKIFELSYCLLYLESQEKEVIKKLGFYIQKLTLEIGAIGIYKKIGLILEKF